MRRTAAVGGVVLLVAACLAVLVGPGAAPAGARTMPVLKVHPNKPVEVSFPGFPVGAGYPVTYAFGSTPEDCSDEGLSFAVCHYIPLRLQVTQEQLDSKFYALAFQLSWPTENIIIPATGVVPLTALSLAVWDDPAVADPNKPPAETPDSCPPDDPILDAVQCLVLGPVPEEEPGGDVPYFNSFLFWEEPLNFGMTPKRTDYAVRVSHLYGPNTEFTLKVSLVDPGDLLDLSVDDFFDFSEIPTPEPSPSLEPSPGLPSDFAAGPTSPAFDFGGLADLGVDSDLDRLGLSDPDRLGLDAVDLTAGRNIRGLRESGSENALAMVFWLAVLPAAFGTALAAWFLRRRSSLFS